MVRIYKRDDQWLMDITVPVSTVMGYKGTREMPITIAPDRHHLALWFALHPEERQQ